jgi:carbonic anhydrase
MEKALHKILVGYKAFRKKYAGGDNSVMRYLAYHGQNPEVMVVACCDSRVDPALILQCDPGDLFTVRNVANIIPPYEKDDLHHGTSAALEFGISYLKVKHLIIFGHSQCGGINTRMHQNELGQDDFISNWVSLIKKPAHIHDEDGLAQSALLYSHENCLKFPFIKKRLEEGSLKIHLWFFNIKNGEILSYSHEHEAFEPLLP